MKKILEANRRTMLFASSRKYHGTLRPKVNSVAEPHNFDAALARGMISCAAPVLGRKRCAAPTLGWKIHLILKSLFGF
jgi:hypothetical protein